MTRLAVVLAATLLLLTGCAAQPTSPEDLYLNEVHAAAKQEGLPWTKDLQDTATRLGGIVCANLAEGLTLAEIRASVHQDDPAHTRVILAAVDAAPAHLCPEGER